MDTENHSYRPTTSSSQAESLKAVEYRTVMCSLVMLVLCTTGLLTNAVSLFLFTRRSMRSSINVLLAGLSAIDGLVLLLALPVFVAPHLIDYYGLSDGKCLDTLDLVSLFGLYQLNMMAQTCSVWTFVLISLERFLAVCYPLKVQRFLTVNRARMAQLAVVVSAVVYNLIRFWEYGWDDQAPKGYRRRLRESYAYLAIYYTSMYLMTHFLCPFLLIAILNLFILRAIRRARDERIKLTHRQSQQHMATQMILVVTAVFAVCNTLPFVLNIWEALRPSLFDVNDSYYAQAYLTLDISNMLVVFNCSSTILIYLVFCRKYRQLLLYYLSRCLLRGLTSRDRYRTIDRHDSCTMPSVALSLSAQMTRGTSAVDCSGQTMQPGHRRWRRANGYLLVPPDASCYSFCASNGSFTARRHSAHDLCGGTGGANGKSIERLSTLSRANSQCV